MYVVQAHRELCYHILAGQHDDVIKGKHFPRYWPFVQGIHRSPVNSPHKGQWRGALMFSLMRLIKQLSKHSRGWWFETLSSPLWRHCNEFLLIWTTKITISTWVILAVIAIAMDPKECFYYLATPDIMENTAPGLIFVYADCWVIKDKVYPHMHCTKPSLHERMSSLHLPSIILKRSNLCSPKDTYCPILNSRGKRMLLIPKRQPNLWVVPRII